MKTVAVKLKVTYAILECVALRCIQHFIHSFYPKTLISRFIQIGFRVFQPSVWSLIL